METKSTKPLSGSLTVKDFVPRQLTPQLPDFLQSVDGDYEAFPDLIAQANAWLQSHPSYLVHTCETVDFKLDNGAPRLIESTFRSRGQRPNCYMRGLRVWVYASTQRKEPDEIDYFNVLPRWKAAENDPAWMVDMQSEPLAYVLARTNVLLRVQPPDGRILCVNTFSVKLKGAGPLPDQTVWKDRGYQKQFFLYGLRIFFIKDAVVSYQLNVVDLLPHTVYAENLYVRHPMVEAFPAVLLQARAFLSRLPPAEKFLNIQTLQFQQDFLQPLDTNRTNFCEDNMHSYQLKFLRLWYTTENHHPSPQFRPLPPRLTPFLNCKLFCPKLLHKPGLFSDGQFESQPDLQQRMIRWLRRTNHYLASVETIIMRVFSGAEHFEGFNTMHTWNRVIHHSNAAHSHRHNFLHGRTHHRHGVRHSESSVAAETFVTVYRAYYFGDSDSEREVEVLDDLSENSLEEYMLAQSAASCCSVM